MVEQPLNLARLKLNHKIVLISVISLLLLILFLTQKKIFFLLAITAASVATSLVMRVFPPMKIVGIELVTFPTILAGSLFGPFAGAVFGFSILIAHLIAANYHGGHYLVWTIPEHALIGVLAGILTGTNSLIVMIIAIQLFNSLLNLVFNREGFTKHFIFALGNVTFNGILILKLFSTITGMI